MQNQNLFNFEYLTQTVKNQDETPSRFSVVYGGEGKVVHCKKDAYQLISTESVSNLGNAFREQGLEVSSFTHKNGEVIGLNIQLSGSLAKVGEKSYNAYITIPNNGGGCGYLAIKELRLVCANGMVRTMSSKNGSIKIPHNLSYPAALNLMQESLEKFIQLRELITARDLEMDSVKITRHQALRLLNQWFYEYEMPIGHKTMSFDGFREMLVTAPDQIKSIARYEELRSAFDVEIGHNRELGLDLSNYTVYATITNYLSRRVEKSKSAAPIEVVEQRVAAKVEKFAQML